VVEAAKARGCRVSVVSTMETAPPMIADDLRREADAFIDLTDLGDLVARPRRDTAEQAAPGEED
jgi:uncharacterized LabA/DUF88 family protein